MPDTAGWTNSPDPADPGYTIGYDPNSPQYDGGTGPAYDIQGPNGGYDSGLEQWPTSLQAAVADYAKANGTTPVVPGVNAPTATNNSGALSNALQPQYAPTPPSAAAATIDPSQQIAEILAGFQPQAQQSTMNLNNSLAAAGITGGGTVGAQQQLQGQLAASLAPSLASAIGGANTSNQQAENSANQFNTSNLINTENGNVSTANNFEQFLASLQNSDWAQQLGAYSSLNQSGLAGQQGINSQYAQNYEVPQGTAAGLGSLTGALGNYYGQSTPTAQSEPWSYTGGGVSPVYDTGGSYGGLYGG